MTIALNQFVTAFLKLRDYCVGSCRTKCEPN